MLAVDALKRVKNINWANEFFESDIEKFGDYLAIAAYFRREHKLESQSLIFDMTQVAKIKLDLPDDYYRSIESLLGPQNSMVKAVCYWYVKWEWFKEQGAISAVLDNPYSPVIEMFENGTQFKQDKGFAVVGDASFYLQNWEFDKVREFLMRGKKRGE
ncbi:hypothetical protein ONV78_16185 [Hahella sp. CR1]|uniref:hypothetical protein n=1 Tax=Hahella sp. CR1 TaxID=2992807 RepID=UPI00244202DA|nr:hypothetical protein [Hahella sp. CR1]MDG9669282.1 hypothetical protein [Hahella sp. CR1]